jgi:hypothetical protein
MVYPTEKAEFISRVAAIFKGGSIKERLRDKITF